MKPTDYPDSALCMVEGYGICTVGEIRLSARAAESRREADLRRLEVIATENLCRPAPCSGDTQQADAA